MKMLINRVQHKEDLKNMLSDNLIVKLNNGTLKEDNIKVVIDEVFKLGREAGKRQ